MVRIQRWVLVLGVLFGREIAYAQTMAFKRVYLKDYTKNEKPYQYFRSSDWIVEALFFDLDGDGRTWEALVASPDQRYADGNRWMPSRYIQGKGVETYTHSRMDVDIHCRNDQFYRLVSSGMSNSLIGRDVSIGRYGASGTYQIERGDVIIDVDSDLRFKLSRLHRGVGEKVVERGFRLLASVGVETYRGVDVIPQPLSYPFSNLTNVSVNGLSTSPFSIARAFETTIRHHRQEVKRRFNTVYKVCVHAVFFNSGNDENGIAYITSDLEKTGDRYVWTLYLFEHGRTRKAVDTYWFNRESPLGTTSFCVEALEPVETTGKDSFYCITRYLGGINRSVVVLEQDEKGRLMSHAHLKYVPRGEREVGDRGSENWLGRMVARLGFVPPYDFEEAISRPEFLQLERLPCMTFPEP